MKVVETATNVTITCTHNNDGKHTVYTYTNDDNNMSINEFIDNESMHVNIPLDELLQVMVYVVRNTIKQTA